MSKEIGCFWVVNKRTYFKLLLKAYSNIVIVPSKGFRFWKMSIWSKFVQFWPNLFTSKENTSKSPLLRLQKDLRKSKIFPNLSPPQSIICDSILVNRYSLYPSYTTYNFPSFSNYEHFYVIDFGSGAVICITERYFEIILAKITKINSLISINNHLHSHT